MKLSQLPSRLSIATLLFGLMAGLYGCTEYQPPFTHYLTQDMDFASVQDIASQKGYTTYRQVAYYRGFCLLAFEKNGGGEDVFLIVDNDKKPAMRTLGFKKLDSDKLVRFVDDLYRHRQQGG